MDRSFEFESRSAGDVTPKTLVKALVFERRREGGCNQTAISSLSVWKLTIAWGEKPSTFVASEDCFLVL